MSIENSAVRHALSGPTMGTRFSVVFYAPHDFDTAPLAAALEGAVDQVDRQMSTWKPESDLNRLNGAPQGEWVFLPRALISVLDVGLRIGQRSGGAFDVGVGEQVAAWGFGAHAAPGAACPAAQKAAGPAVELDLANARARRCTPAQLDLSGIAKGYGVDELARTMNAFGITRYLVGIDGEMRGRGEKPDGPWMVAHERPVPGLREAMGAIELTDLAVATSGNYRHFRVMDGRTLSHTIDPRSGLPVENDMASVTVLARTCMEADAWATALLVMGPDTGMPLARVMGMDAIFVHRDGTVTASL